MSKPTVASLNEILATFKAAQATVNEELRTELAALRAEVNAIKAQPVVPTKPTTQPRPLKTMCCDYTATAASRRTAAKNFYADNPGARSVTDNELRELGYLA